MTSTKPVVLVHGAWHGGWCRATLQAALDRRGVPSIAEAACARLTYQVLDSFSRPMTDSPIGTMPTTYARCTKDRAVHPTHQDFMADRRDRRADLETDHSPFFSKTDELADIIADIARG